MDKKDFLRTHGFSTSAEACAVCRFPRGAHTVWNTEKDYKKHDFVPTGRKHRA